MKEKVFNQLNKLKSFEEVETVLNSIPADNGGYVIRGYIMDYMEEKFPSEFENWL